MPAAERQIPPNIQLPNHVPSPDSRHFIAHGSQQATSRNPKRTNHTAAHHHQDSTPAERALARVRAISIVLSKTRNTSTIGPSGRTTSSKRCTAARVQALYTALSTARSTTSVAVSHRPTSYSTGLDHIRQQPETRAIDRPFIQCMWIRVEQRRGEYTSEQG